MTLHSRANGDSATRGVAIDLDGAVCNSASVTSLCSLAISLDVRLTFSASEATAALMTNSPVASTLRSVSFFVASRRSVGEKTTTGGLAPKALKKLKGAKLITPPGERVVTQAIGRGVTSPTSK